MNWEDDLRKQVKNLGPKTYLSISKDRGTVLLRYKNQSGNQINKRLHFKWNELLAGDIYTRIRNIY